MTAAYIFVGRLGSNLFFSNLGMHIRGTGGSSVRRSGDGRERCMGVAAGDPTATADDLVKPLRAGLHDNRQHEGVASFDVISGPPCSPRSVRTWMGSAWSISTRRLLDLFVPTGTSNPECSDRDEHRRPEGDLL